MKKCVLLLMLFVCPVLGESKKELPSPFFIYNDFPSKENHYIASGYMGDYGDVKMDLKFSTNTASGLTCIRVVYLADRLQGAGWSGVYWQHPHNNWGDKKGGYNLSGFKKLKFKARGARGGEYIDKFFMGGIVGQTQDGDSDQIDSDSIELTNKWKEYEIGLQGLDLSHIIGGFGFVMNADTNPDGFVMYLDEIRYEK